MVRRAREAKPLRTYGWIPDRPDGRDFLYRAIRKKVRLDKTVDLRAQCSRVEDQGNLGSCTALALAGNIEFLDNRTDSEYADVSRLFIYYNERVIIDTVDYDSGAMLRDGIKTLKNDGVCPERVWPYRIGKFKSKPPANCYKEAAGRRIASYYRIASLDEMLNCLAEGFPFVFGFTVYESFESPKTAQTGVVPMPQKSESPLGGHAVLAVGYHRKARRFIIRNSWGAGWGMDGYGTMPFAYLEELGDDFWTIRK